MWWVHTIVEGIGWICVVLFVLAAIISATGFQH